MIQDEYEIALQRFRIAQAGGFRQRERAMANVYGTPREYPMDYCPKEPRGVDTTARNLDMLGARKHDPERR